MSTKSIGIFRLDVEAFESVKTHDGCGRRRQKVGLIVGDVSVEVDLDYCKYLGRKALLSKGGRAKDGGLVAKVVGKAHTVPEEKGSK